MKTLHQKNQPSDSKKVGWLFWAVPQAALEDERLSPAEVMILGILYTRRNAEMVAWPSQKYLAEKIHCSERNIRRNIEHLKVLGWIATERDELNQKNSYQLLTLGDGTGQNVRWRRTQASGTTGQKCPALHIEEIDLRDKYNHAEKSAWGREDITAYLNGMMQGSNKANQIIAEYWMNKGGVGWPGSGAAVQFGSKSEAQREIVRNSRIANALVKSYPLERIFETMGLLAEHATFSWTLESVSKYIYLSPQKIKESLTSMKKKVYA